ncbi:NAD(P)/FAD-dependent oxidoreductase [Streptomyces sp. NPDC055186]
MTSDERVVVIGAGLAGVRLARRLGELGTPVTLIGEEGHRPYNRVLLAEVLAGRYGPEVIALPAPGEPVRARVTGVDRAARTVTCADGSVIGYGRLVLATGSDPVLPPLRGLFGAGAAGIPGVPGSAGTPGSVGTSGTSGTGGTGGAGSRELPEGVRAFRTLDDCLGLDKALRPGVRAVVIGGGLLGVSAARALAVRGARVVLAQRSGRLMERRLDPAASALVERHLAGLGVDVRTECRVRDVRCAGGAVRSVEPADGHALDADLVVLACGARPRTGLAEAAGLTVREGIVVDDELRTSDPSVHAIGDCAQHAGTVYGLAAPALEQADVLAALLAGDTGARYTGTRSLTRLTLTGRPDPFDLAAFGEAEALPGDGVVRLTDATRGTHRKVVVREGRLVGGVLVGELGTVGALARAWEGAEPLPPDGGSLLHLLTHDGGS